MTILDNLIEKKDILLYLKFRIKRLKEESNQIKKYPQEDRARVHKLLTVRRAELDRLLQLISEGKLKQDCKKMWNHFEKKNNKLKENGK